MLERVIDVVDQVTAAVREKQGESLKKVEKNAALQSNKTYATPRRPGDIWPREGRFRSAWGLFLHFRHLIRL